MGQTGGTQRSLSLSEGETVVRVRYWADKEALFRLEVTTSKGAVYGPWGKNEGTKFDLRVRIALVCFDNFILCKNSLVVQPKCEPDMGSKKMLKIFSI